MDARFILWGTVLRILASPMVIKEYDGVCVVDAECMDKCVNSIHGARHVKVEDKQLLREE